jgi:prepilin-type N-terminal cleavage/methylation domain-containing protein
MTRTRRQSRGFTLLELILAMGMVVVLSASLFVTLNIAFRAKRAADRAVRPIRVAAMVSDTITRDFEAIVMPSAASNDTTGTAIYLAGPFFGTNSVVTFCCLESDGLPGDVPLSEGIREVTYGVNTNGNLSVLQRNVRRNLMAPTAEEPQEEVVARNVETFELSYFDGTDWYPDWDSTQLAGAIPTIVKVSLTIRVPEPGVDPDQTLQPGQYTLVPIQRMIRLVIAKPVTVDAATITG